MNELFDDLARIIASPVSRRQAFRLLSRAAGGALLTSLGLGRALRGWAGQALTCPSGSTLCTKGSVTTCCSNNGQKCCTDDVGAYCCTAGQTCCNGKCCKSGAVCCSGKCCKAGPSGDNRCIAAKCEAARALGTKAVAGIAAVGATTGGVLAATSGAKPKCSSGTSPCGSAACCSTNTQKCCSDIITGYCCSPNQICCNGTCCNQNRICCSGKCCTPTASSSNPCTGATCS